MTRLYYTNVTDLYLYLRIELYIPRHMVTYGLFAFILGKGEMQVNVVGSLPPAPQSVLGYTLSPIIIEVENAVSPIIMEVENGSI